MAILEVLKFDVLSQNIKFMIVVKTTVQNEIFGNSLLWLFIQKMYFLRIAILNFEKVETMSLATEKKH